MEQNNPYKIDDFPVVQDVDVAFNHYPDEWFKKILNQGAPLLLQKEIMMANKIFFHGGKLPLREDLDKDYVIRGVRMFKAVVGSYAPKHEHKEIVCAMILKNICEEIKDEGHPTVIRNTKR